MDEIHCQLCNETIEDFDSAVELTESDFAHDFHSRQDMQTWRENVGLSA